MTLTKAIEAVRSGLSEIDRFLVKWKLNHVPAQDCAMMTEVFDATIAALPDKPMTEDELVKLVYQSTKFPITVQDSKDIIAVLKAANILYLAE